MSRLNQLSKTLTEAIKLIEASGLQGYVFVSDHNSEDKVGAYAHNFNQVDGPKIGVNMVNSLANLKVNYHQNPDSDFNVMYDVLCAAFKVHLKELQDENSYLNKHIRYLTGDLDTLTPAEIAYFKSIHPQYEVVSVQK